MPSGHAAWILPAGGVRPRAWLFRVWLLAWALGVWLLQTAHTATAPRPAELAYFLGATLMAHELFRVSKIVFAYASRRALLLMLMAAAASALLSFAADWTAGLPAQPLAWAARFPALFAGVLLYSAGAHLGSAFPAVETEWPAARCVLIAGAGTRNRMLAARLTASKSGPRVAGFVTSDRSLAGYDIDGVPVLGAPGQTGALQSLLGVEELWTADAPDSSFAYLPVPVRVVDPETGADRSDDPLYLESLRALSGALGEPAPAPTVPPVSTSPAPEQTPRA